MPNAQESEIIEKQVRFKRSGDLVQRIDGAEVVVAHYDHKTGTLEYASKDISKDINLSNKITSRITMTKGTSGTAVNPSGLMIRNVCVKGEARPDPKKQAPRPKMGPLGDAAYDQAKWLYDNDVEQFKTKYRCVLTPEGDFVRKHARRIVVETIDQRDQEGELGKTPEGKGSFSTGPVSRVGDAYEERHAIIALRETHPGPNGEPPLTFIPQEVVGGFVPDDGMTNAALAVEVEYDA